MTYWTMIIVTQTVVQNGRNKSYCNVCWKSCFFKIPSQRHFCHQIIATNVVLKKIAITNCEQSTLYYDEKDFVEHFFWRCFFTKRFWQVLENIISKSCKTACYVEITENKHNYYWCRFLPHDFISKLIPFINANFRNV